MSEDNVLDALVERVREAQRRYATFTQQQVDAIFRAAASAAASARIELAELAVAESGMGVVEDKVIKNHFASEYIYNAYKDMKTCGTEDRGDVITIAEPVGVICAIVPATNPTSTTIFKTLISLKTRNGIIFSPHPRAFSAANRAAEIVLQAAVTAGAPPDIIGWLPQASVSLADALIRHSGVDMVLATGGPGRVKAAYSSGKPAIGVGAGNTPVVVDESADIRRMVASVLMSKTFDNGMVCASEQSVIVVESLYDDVRARFAEYGGYLLNASQREAVRAIIMREGKINPDIVGQPACKIARLAGIEVPAGTKVLIGEVIEVGEKEPFSGEKLSPLLALYRARDFFSATALAAELVAFGGAGHTSCLYIDQDRQKERICQFGERLKTSRILINSPASQGGIGDLYNFSLPPSMTLGCGSWGGNSVSENIGPRHLLNYKTLARRAENMLWHKIPPAIYFRRGALLPAVEEVISAKPCRVFIVTGPSLLKQGTIRPLLALLQQRNIPTETFSDISGEPTLSMVNAGRARMQAFSPDVIIAIGGGSPMDAAKVMWFMYEHPEVAFDTLAQRFMDIRKRIHTWPETGLRATFVAVPTTSGTGAEVSPFAVITDDATGQKYPLADYTLTPDMAVVDADLVMSMPPTLCAHGGMDAITHALESFVSVYASEYSDGLALQALVLMKEYLLQSYHGGAHAPEAREKVHNAATIAGMAFSNAFLGICHSMAHKIGAEFHLPHGLANALLIINVIRFNASDCQSKQTAFSQYPYPRAAERYARLSRHLGLCSVDESQSSQVSRLIDWLEGLKAEMGIPDSMQQAGVEEHHFLSVVDRLGRDAFDDQCTATNPRYPLIPEIRQLLLACYYGRVFEEVQ